MRGSLRDKVEHPDLRLKRSRYHLLDLFSPTGRILVCVVTPELGMVSERPTMWETSGTVMLEGKEVHSVLLLTHCVTSDLFVNAAVPCSKADLTDRNHWLGLLEQGEEKVFHQAERRTLQDLQPPIQ